MKYIEGIKYVETIQAIEIWSLQKMSRSQDVPLLMEEGYIYGVSWLES